MSVGTEVPRRKESFGLRFTTWQGNVKHNFSQSKMSCTLGRSSQFVDASAD